jgi:hypothetical protein
MTGHEATEFTDAALAADANPGRHSGLAAHTLDVVGLAAEDTPGGAKVPEPAALPLFAGGLIEIVRTARKRTRV